MDSLLDRLRGVRAEVAADGSGRVVRVGCPAHNCGGRCLLLAHVQDGRVVRLDADDRPDTVGAPQLRACVRGRAYLRRQYHPDRLLYPLKRSGERGEGRFERVSWDEAWDLLAAGITRIRERHGSGAMFVPYGTGAYNQVNGPATARRALHLSGGCLGHWNSYSWAAINVATPTVYGTLVTGNQRQDWLNSKLILMWGWNPAEMRDGTNSDYFVKLARSRGTRTICIDPRHTLTAQALADEWVPIRPGTDAALMTAMAHVIVEEGLHDADFVRTHCVGFDSSQMPPGCEAAESYVDYLFGRRDGVPKTPDWAEPITAVPRDVIARLAREYATARPAVLYQGYGMQRRAYGEQVVRAGCVLAAITGNVGVPGGWASGLGLQAPDGGAHWTVFPLGDNPVEASIPVFLWSEAVLRGPELTAEDGVKGAERLDAPIRGIWAVASNCLVNQHANVNRSARILTDPELVELLVVQDNFLTPTARFADLVLPACTQWETWGVQDGWKYGDEVILLPKLVDPPGECLSDYAIARGLATRLGVEAAYSEGRDERGWVEWCLDVLATDALPRPAALDELLAANVGVWGRSVERSGGGLRGLPSRPRRAPARHAVGEDRDLLQGAARPGPPRRDPRRAQVRPGVGEPVRRRGAPVPAAAHRPPHPAARSLHPRQQRLARRGVPAAAVHQPAGCGGARPRGRPGGAGVQRPRRGARPLEAHRADHAGGRGPAAGGVVDARPSAASTARGSVNVLTSERWTPLAKGSAQHTAMVEVEEARP